MSSNTELDRQIDRQEANLITRREAIRRVTALLGGAALIGGNALLTGCRDDRAGAGASNAAEFTEEEIAFLDEIAETILPETNTPGAKAAGVGPFMALMVKDTYDENEQRIFREGMQKLDDASREMHNASFMEATPEQRLALLERLDREQIAYMQERDRRINERKRAEGWLVPADTARVAGSDTARAESYLPDQRQELAPSGDASAAPGITADAPPHYFRMMKELALLGYFTSEIGYTQAMRYIESPGRFEPCAPYAPGEKAWAPHA